MITGNYKSMELDCNFPSVTPQVLSADGVPLKVDAVMFYRVVDPVLWVTRVSDGYQATHTLAQTTMRATLGAHTLGDILAQRKRISQRTEVSQVSLRSISQNINMT